MKRIIIKTLSLGLAVIFILLTLMSCDPTTDQGEQNGGNSNTNGGSSSTSHYYGVKTVYSYDEVMDALAIVRQRRTVKPTYTVKDMGEDYTIFYQFQDYNFNRPYPIDYDVFFNTYSSGFFSTCIFFENKTCSSERHGWHTSETIHTYKEDEDYEKLKNTCKEKACVNIIIVNAEKREAVELENNIPDVYGGSFNDLYEFYTYHIFYGMEIMQLWSCVELDDEFFDVFLPNIVTTRVTE